MRGNQQAQSGSSNSLSAATATASANATSYSASSAAMHVRGAQGSWPQGFTNAAPLQAQGANSKMLQQQRSRLLRSRVALRAKAESDAKRAQAAATAAGAARGAGTKVVSAASRAEEKTGYSNVDFATAAARARAKARAHVRQQQCRSERMRDLEKLEMGRERGLGDIPSRREIRGGSRGPHIPKSKKQIETPKPPRESHMVRNIILVLFLLIVLVCGGVSFRVYQDLQSVNTYKVAAREEPYELKEGATVATVVRDLASDKYHELVLKLWVKINHHYYPMIQQGPYAIDGNKTLSEILTDMREGNIVKIKLPTIPLIEGMTITTIVQRLGTHTDLVQSPALAAVVAQPQEFITVSLTKDGDQSLLQAIGGTHESLEGLLMPATYDYKPQETESLALVRDALVNMATFMREHYISRDQSIDEVIKNPYHVLVLASIVERESAIESERGTIAGVFLNRLRQGIKLQTDPAVMYGVSPDFKGPLLRSQLRRDTPYNTYTRAGLPPTPIAMPSESAIMAVLHPEKTDALFFVARGPDPQQGHVFSSTLREHNRAVNEYRRAVRDYKNEQQRLQRQQQQAQAQ